MFIQSAFIRKNSPELREKLEELGYEPNAYESFWEDNNRYIITKIDSQGYAFYTLCIKNCYLLENELFIDCGDNEELFLAIAALRDDDNYMQWFTDGENWFQNKQNDIEVIKYGAGNPINFHKATVEELIKHFK